MLSTGGGAPPRALAGGVTAGNRAPAPLLTYPSPPAPSEIPILPKALVHPTQVVRAVSHRSKKTVRKGFFSLKLGITQILSKRSYRRYAVGQRREQDEDEDEGRTLDNVQQSRSGAEAMRGGGAAE